MTGNSSKQNEIPRTPLNMILREQGASQEQISKVLQIYISKMITEKLVTGSTAQHRSQKYGFNRFPSSPSGILLEKALKTQDDRLDEQRQLEAKLLSSGLATKEQLNEAHNKQLEAMNKDEMPSFKKLFEECGIQPKAIKQAEIGVQRDIAYCQMQTAIERRMHDNQYAESPADTIERDYRFR